jgi:hypothetical protein
MAALADAFANLWLLSGAVKFDDVETPTGA